MRRIINWIKNKKLWFPLELLKWVLIDIIRGKPKKIFGIQVFVGMPGEGKTIGMVTYLEHMRKKHTDLKVYTNFGYIHETEPITDWKKIYDIPKKSIIAIDELQISFDSARWGEFPIEMIQIITQNRKRQIQFIASTQDWALININFRRLTNYVVQCRNYLHLDRWFRFNYYRPDVYELKGQITAKMTPPEWTEHYVAGDDVYQLYNTEEIIQSINKQEKARLKAAN